MKSTLSAVILEKTSVVWFSYIHSLTSAMLPAGRLGIPSEVRIPDQYCAKPIRSNKRKFLWGHFIPISSSCRPLLYSIPPTRSERVWFDRTRTAPSMHESHSMPLLDSLSMSDSIPSTPSTSIGFILTYDIPNNAYVASQTGNSLSVKESSRQSLAAYSIP